MVDPDRHRGRYTVAGKREVKPRLKMAVEVVGANYVLQRDGDRLGKTAGLGRSEHEWLRYRSLSCVDPVRGTQGIRKAQGLRDHLRQRKVSPSSQRSLKRR